MCPESRQQEELEAEIRTFIPGNSIKDNHLSTIWHAVVLEYLDLEYHAETWAHMCTGGLATDVTTNDGIRVHIDIQNDTKSFSSYQLALSVPTYVPKSKAINATVTTSVLLIAKFGHSHPKWLSSLLALTSPDTDAAIKEQQDRRQELCS